jgi:hypothetical protein
MGMAVTHSRKATPRYPAKAFINASAIVFLSAKAVYKQAPNAPMLQATKHSTAVCQELSCGSIAKIRITSAARAGTQISRATNLKHEH